MKKLYYFTFLSLILLLMSCSPTMNSVWVKDSYSPEHFNNVAVIVVNKNMEVKRAIEADILTELTKKGVEHVVKGETLLPHNLGKEAWTAENISKLLAENNIDAVITVSYIGNYEETNYESGTLYGAAPYGYVGRRVYGYYNTIYTPGYYTVDQNYVLQADLYSAKGTNKEDALLFTGQSTVYSPSSVASGSKSYSKDLVNYLYSNNILK